MQRFFIKNQESSKFRVGALGPQMELMWLPMFAQPNVYKKR